MSGMDWVRQPGSPLQPWHLVRPPEPGSDAPSRGLVLAACGLPLGLVDAELEHGDGAVVGGDRCSACQGLALAQQL
jgi:hypothetical protein